MILIKLLLILGVSCLAYSYKCKTPVPKDHFSMRRFSGTWFQAAMEEQGYEDPTDPRCVMFYFHYDNGYIKHDKWSMEVFSRQTTYEEIGTYYLPEGYKKGLIKLEYPDTSLSYNFTVMCTDYDTYFTAYACELSLDDTQEIVFLFVRDVAMYDQVISNPRVQRCFKDVFNKPVKEMHKTLQEKCLN